MNYVWEALAAIIWLVLVVLFFEGFVILFQFPLLIVASVFPGILTIAALYCISAQKDARKHLSDDALSHLVPKHVTFTLEGDRLIWVVQRCGLSPRLKAPPFLWPSIGVGIAVATIILYKGYRSVWTSHLVFLYEPLIVAIASFFLATVILIACRWTLIPILGSWFEAHHHRKALKKRLHVIFAPLRQLSPSFHSLRLLEGDINGLSDTLDIPRPESFLNKAVWRIAANACEAAADPQAAATKFIDPLIREAQSERDNLRRAVKAFTSVAALADEVGAELHKLGNVSLLDLYCDFRAGFDSEALKALIACRRWSDFFDIINGSSHDLEDLRAAAHASSRTAGARKKKQQTGQKRKHQHKAQHDEGTMTIEKACAVLQVSPSATKDEIAKAFRHLAAMWHPDTGRVTNDNQMKRISEAYAFLKQEMQSA